MGMPIHTDGRIRSLQAGGAVARQLSFFVEPVIQRNAIPCQFDDLLDSKAARLESIHIARHQGILLPLDLGGQMRTVFGLTIFPVVSGIPHFPRLPCHNRESAISENLPDPSNAGLSRDPAALSLCIQCMRMEAFENDQRARHHSRQPERPQQRRPAHHLR